ncbi:sugar-proton symporter [Neoasaia chiangmaiensis NBRC 101099]|uniref:D-galactose transporter GalP n=1 Tax=Neoasaia chiangmaiensis TaxID=320497 RepID=A0A1U9KPL8_9PROT|nr:sugar porter family MFS transporter [Neoasaia chiangmaiensis]AQS87756.1 D-galactose transporter GalP [Neoasaia chiangmaiensis]GBR41656.1 sugar-proton symporter [Neoasaia chiangmaiensis NBRC 101099]GEN14353.1 galactose-proton symporter [Neoasaia chiangmaiensis]
MNAQTDQSTITQDVDSTGFDATNFKMIVIGVVAALAGLMSGLDIGVVAGALDFFAKRYHASMLAQEWVVSAMMAGAAVGALGAGWLSHSLGRKRSLILGAAVFVVGSVGCALCWSVPSMMFFRVIMGLAVGLSAFTAPLYLSEIASEETRGAMVSTYQLMVTVGIFIAFLSNTYFSYSGDWRWMFGVAAIPAALFLVGVTFLPYSPRWLIIQGRHKEAREVLLSLRDDPLVAAQEIRAIREQLEVKQHGMQLLRENPNFRRSLALGVMLQAMQQLAGINIIMYYAPHILEKAGFDATSQMWCTAIIGLVNMLATFIAVGLVDKWGRKPILYIGFTVMALGMAALATLLAHGMNSQASQLLAVFLLLIFCTGFAMSAGPLMWVLCSEIQPMQGRDLGIALSTLTNWVTNMIVGASFLTLMTTIGTAGTFWLFAAFNAVFVVLTYLFVPETKGMSLDVMEKRLLSGTKLRELGR